MAKLSYKMSYYALYVCFAVILVVLGMFFLVGYNNPVGDMNAPEHTETLIYLMYALFGVTVGLTVIAAIAQFGAALKDNPMGAIKSLLGLVLLVAVVLISYAMGSDATITANEAPYTDNSSFFKSYKFLVVTWNICPAPSQSEAVMIGVWK